MKIIEKEAGNAPLFKKRITSTLPSDFNMVLELVRSKSGANVVFQGVTKPLRKKGWIGDHKKSNLSLSFLVEKIRLRSLIGLLPLIESLARRRKKLMKD